MCSHCKNKPKYGSPGKKKNCVKRKYAALQLATNASVNFLLQGVKISKKVAPSDGKICSVPAAPASTSDNTTPIARMSAHAFAVCYLNGTLQPVITKIFTFPMFNNGNGANSEEILVVSVLQ